MDGPVPIDSRPRIFNIMADLTVNTNASLRPFNTFGIEAKASHLVTITDPQELIRLIQSGTWQDVPKMVLGGGSNILLTRDVEGLVILNRIMGISVVDENDEQVYLHAGGGVVWHDFVLYAVRHGWGGLENLSLIPGTVGAAPIQNIGAYGVEIKDSFHELQTVSLMDGSVRTFSRDECAFGYRDSLFKREAKGKYMIVGVTFRLTKNPTTNTSYGAISQELSKMGVSHPTIGDVSQAVIAIRQSKLPDPAVMGNAGSFFKNPEVPDEEFAVLKTTHPDLPGYPAKTGFTKLAAGYLIEKSGWKGKVMGHVGMHKDQALVLVNHGGATGHELIEHAKRVQESVLKNFGVWLEMEVNIL